MYLFIGETRPRPAPSRAAEDEDPASPWRDAVFLQMLLVSFAFSLMFFSHITELPLTITLTAGYPARLYGVLVAVNGLLIALFEMSVVERLRPFRRLRVAALGTLAHRARLRVSRACPSIGPGSCWWCVAYTAGEILAVAAEDGVRDGLGAPGVPRPLPELLPGDLEPRHRAEPDPVPAPARASGDSAFWPLMMLLAAPSARSSCCAWTAWPTVRRSCGRDGHEAPLAARGGPPPGQPTAERAPPRRRAASSDTGLRGWREFP